jgi:hypothetical protein
MIDWDKPLQVRQILYGLLDDFNSHFKIRNTPERKVVKGWLNIYSGGWMTIHETKEDADGRGACASPRIACLKIEREYYEGEGLEGGE